MFRQLIFILSAVSMIPAAPIFQRNSIAASSLVQVSPATASCVGAAYPSECRDATVAAPNIAISFTNFAITSFGAQAALVALMLYESGNFQYAQNHFPAPGVPGKGTRNMQSPAQNLKYAEWLATSCANCDISKEMVANAQMQGPAAVLELVNTNEWSFGSAAWFLATQCDAIVAQKLAAGTFEAWNSYLSDCVGTSATEERNKVWSQVMALKAW